MIRQIQLPPTEARLLPEVGGLAARSATPATNDESDFNMHAVLQILLRRRVWMYVCTATMLVAAALVCIFMTPQYKAESKIEILAQDVSTVSLNDPNNSSGGGSDTLDFNLTLQTELAVLKSDTLAWQVIKELNLTEPKDVHPEESINTANKRSAAILQNFKNNLRVEPIVGTRLIAISYTHPNATMAAKIVNQLVSDFVEYNFQVRYNATTKTTEWLGHQLVDLKSQVEKSQERALELQKESGIYGEDEHHNIVIARLEQLNSEVTTAEATRVIKEAVYNLARNGNPELVAGMLGANPGQSGTGAANSLSLLLNLRQQEASLNSEYADSAAKYGPAYPKLIQMKERLSSLHSSIQTELNKVVDRAKREYELAGSQEAAAQKAFADQKLLASRMNDKAIDYTIAQHEADSNRQLYDHLLQKLKEAEMLAGLHSSKLHILDPAEVPDHPAKPNVPVYLALGTLAGMSLGLACVFVVESMDRTIRNPEDIEATTYVPVLGIIPYAGLSLETGRKGWLKAHGQKDGNGRAHANTALPILQNSAVAEAFRSLRTSLLLSQPFGPARIFMITSCMPQEGKSFASLNLAAALAHNGNRVLLVDADLRSGTLSRALRQHSGSGLSQLLLGKADGETYRRVDEISDLTFLPSGACTTFASELLGSPRMAAMMESWRQQFAYVLVDTPPVLPVTDAVVLSPKADAVLVVVRFALTNRLSISRTIRVLRDAQTERLGVLVNAMNIDSPEHYEYSGSWGYDGYHNGNSGKSQPVVPISLDSDS